MSNSLIFITGATGFIGSHVVKVSLEAGYSVRLGIRKPEQAPKIIERYPGFESKIETVIIPDFSKSEAFKDALPGVDFVFHIASPMPGTGPDVREDYVKPAVAATEGILRAALDFPQIKKVVVMSSALALAPVDALFSHTMTFKDNTGEVVPVDLDMEFPEGAMGHGLKYAASKIRAHQATREFVKAAKPKYTLITLHPTFVLGDSMIQTSAKDIDGINGMFWQSLFSEKPIMASGAWVHVRDVADAHVKVLENSIPSGQEFLLSGPEMYWEESVKFINTEFPNLGCKLQSPFEGGWDVDVSATNKLLGLKWRSRETVIRDVVTQQLSFQESSS